MTSTTPQMEFGVEYETTITDGNDDKLVFRVQNIDFGIVERARQHININVLALAAEETNVNDAYEMLKVFMNTKFLEGRYQERLDLLDEYENLK